MVASQQEAEKDKVHVPTTIEEYCIKHNHSKSDEIQDFTDNFYDDYDMDDYDDDNLEDEDDDDEANDLESDQEANVNTAKPANPADVQNSQPADCLAEKTKQKVEEDSGNEEL